ncbi:MAG: TonB-dependent receptor [Pseudomonadota bacterium]
MTADEEAMFFEEIPSVFGASKYEQKISEAPAAVSIITAEEIRRYGHRNLADVLRSVSGFYMTYDRAYTFPGVRGFGRLGDYNTRLLLLVDGYRLNDNIFEQAFIGNETIIDIDMIDRIEIIRGPGSSLYGTNAFFATINLITKRGRDLQGAEASLEAGRHQMRKGRLSYGNRFDTGLEALFSVAAYDSEGKARLYYPEYDDPSTNDGIAAHGDGERYRNALLTLAYQRFTLQAGWGAREKHLPTAPYGADFNEPRNKISDPEQRFVNLRYEHEFDNDSSVSARIGYNTYHYQGRYLFGGTAWLDEDHGAWWTGEALLRHAPNERHKLLVGFEGQYNARQHQSSFDGSGYVLDDNRDSGRWALYAQDEIRWREDLIVNLGVRYDHYDTFGGTTNPRLALIHNQDENTYKLAYGTAFRAPNVFEMFYSDNNVSQKTNPDLRPEEIKTLELIWERQLNRQLRGLLTAFRYEVDGLITQVTDPDDGLMVYRNLATATASGAEMELEGKLPHGVEGRLSYTWQRSRNSSTGNEMINSPQRLAKLNVAVPLFNEALWSGVEVQHSAARRTRSGAHSDAHTVVNWTLTNRGWLPNLSLSLTVYNLFGAEYFHPASDVYAQDVIQQDGRDLRLKLEYAF